MGQWQSQPLCTTPACIHAAANIFQNLHPQWETMDPCTDFGEMVCYGFKQHTATDLEGIFKLDRINKRIVQSILESPDHATAAGIRSTYLTTRGVSDDEENFEILRTAYQACMDPAVTAASIQPLTDFLVSINKTWPVTDFTSTVGSDYDGLFEATLKVEELGIAVFRENCDGMGGIPNPSEQPSDHKLIHACLPHPKLTKPDLKAYTDPAEVAKLAGLFAQLFQVVYPTWEKEAVMGLGEAVAAFEADVGKLLLSFNGQQVADDLTETLKVVSLAEASAAAPAISVDRLLTALVGKKPSTVLVEKLSFWPQFSEIISKHPKAALQGFIAVKAIFGLASYVESDELRKIYKTPTSGERGLDCVDAVTAMASELVDSYYLKAAYNDQTQQGATKLTTKILAAFKTRVGELEWMGAEAKQRAIKKVENMVQNIGYRTDKTINPDVLSATSLATYYRGLNISTPSHFSNALHGLRDRTAKTYAKVGLPADYMRTSFVRPISGPNALYYAPGNSIVIPAGFIQLPMFHHELPDYAVYGGLGSIIGHEITHGFDSNGRMWDENAVYSKWWDNGTITNFAERAQCFVEQFGSYQVDTPAGKANVSGEITLAENIADAGGLSVAYEAWVAERKAMPSAWDQDLPGLDMFTHEQLFFISWGNNWCSSYSDAVLQTRLVQDNHAPASARLSLTAQNSRAFKEAYKCKVKEPTCEIF